MSDATDTIWESIQWDNGHGDFEDCEQHFYEVRAFERSARCSDFLLEKVGKKQSLVWGPRSDEENKLNVCYAILRANHEAYANGHLSKDSCLQGIDRTVGTLQKEFGYKNLYYEMLGQFFSLAMAVDESKSKIPRWPPWLLNTLILMSRMAHENLGLSLNRTSLSDGNSAYDCALAALREFAIETPSAYTVERAMKDAFSKKLGRRIIEPSKSLVAYISYKKEGRLIVASLKFRK